MANQKKITEHDIDITTAGVPSSLDKRYVTDANLALLAVTSGTNTGDQDLSALATKASPTFTGTVALPSTTSIGGVSATELGYLDGVTSSVQTQLNGKLTSATGTVDYIQKVTGINALGNSRILDNGLFIGIGTTSSPTKDITFGNQADKEIGIEQSDNTSSGKNLSVRGGRAIDFIPNSGFQIVGNSNSALYGLSAVAPNGDVLFGRADGGGIIRSLGSGNFAFFQLPYMYPNDMTVTKNNNLYILASTSYYGGSPSNLVYQQINRIGAFDQMVVTNSDKVWISVTSDLVTGDVYFAEANGNIYKRALDTGPLVSLGVTPRNWNRIRFCSDGSLYAILQGTADIYKMTNVAGDFVATGSTARGYGYITTSSNGDVLASEDYGLNIYKKAAGDTLFTFSQTAPVGVYALQSTLNGSLYFCGNNGLMYFQNNDAVGSPDLNGGTLKLAAGTGKGEGASNYDIYTGQKTVSGTDMQIETLRARINNEGLMTLPSTTNAVIEADVTGKAVITKEYLSSFAQALPNTAYVDCVLGDDATASLGYSSKPYLTIDAAKLALEINSGDSSFRVIEFIRGGTYYINSTFKNAYNYYLKSNLNITVSWLNNINPHGWESMFGKIFIIDMPNSTIDFSSNTAKGWQMADYAPTITANIIKGNSNSSINTVVNLTCNQFITTAGVPGMNVIGTARIKTITNTGGGTLMTGGGIIDFDSCTSDGQYYIAPSSNGCTIYHGNYTTSAAVVFPYIYGYNNAVHIKIIYKPSSVVSGKVTIGTFNSGGRFYLTGEVTYVGSENIFNNLYTWTNCQVIVSNLILKCKSFIYSIWNSDHTILTPFCIITNSYIEVDNLLFEYTGSTTQDLIIFKGQNTVYCAVSGTDYIKAANSASKNITVIGILKTNGILQAGITQNNLIP